MINKKKLLEIIASALKVKKSKIKENTKSSDIDEWDSLGQLNILSKLDVILDGKTAKIKKLSECYSVNSIYKLLIKHKLLK
tara:strand:+ start:32458 stop:32700 length:243 start_codon:yes stop_codon:yes gene_type:complete